MTLAMMMLMTMNMTVTFKIMITMSTTMAVMTTMMMTTPMTMSLKPRLNAIAIATVDFYRVGIPSRSYHLTRKHVRQAL